MATVNSVICPYCKHDHGIMRNADKGKIERVCRECKKTFIIEALDVPTYSIEPLTEDTHTCTCGFNGSYLFAEVTYRVPVSTIKSGNVYKISESDNESYSITMKCPSCGKVVTGILQADRLYSYIAERGLGEFVFPE